MKKQATSKIGEMIRQRLMPQAFMAVTSPSADSRPNMSRQLIRILIGIDIARAGGTPYRKMLNTKRHGAPRASRSVIRKATPIDITKVITSKVTRKVITNPVAMYL